MASAVGRTMTGIEKNARLPYVSLVICNHNGRRDLVECLRSARALDYPRYELIVVDNASTDGSVEAVRESFPHVRLIANAKNLGYCAANNQGMRMAKGDILVLLNADTVLRPNLLKSAVAVFQAHAEVGMLSPMVSYRGDIWISGYHVNLRTGRTWFDVDPVDQLRACDYVSGCALFVRREVIDTVGLLDERFFAYYEDVDWGIRTRRRDWRVVVLPKRMVHHKVSESWGATSPEKSYYMIRNRLWLVAKNGSAFDILVFLLIAEPLNAMAEMAHLFIPPVAKGMAKLLGLSIWVPAAPRRAGGFVRALLKARWDALRQLPQVLADRRSQVAA